MKITPEAVRQAYIEKKLTPLQGAFAVQLTSDGVFCAKPGYHGSCCAIGALLVGETCPTKAIADRDLGAAYISTAAEELFDVTIDDFRAFWAGFDGVDREFYTDDHVNRAAYDLGVASWEAVKDLVP